MSSIWIRAIAWTSASVVLALIVWLLFGAAWGALSFLGTTSVHLAHHIYQLDRLDRWAREPIGTPVPPGHGMWAHVFSALHRRARVSSEQRKLLSAALDRFREASQAMPDGVTLLYGANLIEWMNGSAEAHFDVDYQRDADLPLTNIVRQPEFVAYLESEPTGEPLTIQSLRKPEQVLSVQAIPYGDNQKLLISRDITHVDRLETMRRDFVANVSHEMRTPLTVVSGYLEMLSDEPGNLSSEEAQRFIAAAREQTMRMQHLVADLLTLSALETNAPAPDDESLDVAALLETVRGEAETLSAGRHDIRLVTAVPQGTYLLGSAREIHSAFSNLASNAVRYTPAGGNIRIGWNIVDAGQGVLWVEDNGIGIEAKHIPRLTERFYRVDGSRSRETGGTGLGLAIVKHVLERHQAKLEVESTPGKGSRFAVRFPQRRIAVRDQVTA